MKDIGEAEDLNFYGSQNKQKSPLEEITRHLSQIKITPLKENKKHTVTLTEDFEEEDQLDN